MGCKGRVTNRRRNRGVAAAGSNGKPNKLGSKKNECKIHWLEQKRRAAASFREQRLKEEDRREKRQAQFVPSGLTVALLTGGAGGF
jgi:hypothetical protein